MMHDRQLGFPVTLLLIMCHFISRQHFLWVLMEWGFLIKPLSWTAVVQSEAPITLQPFGAHGDAVREELCVLEGLEGLTCRCYHNFLTILPLSSKIALTKHISHHSKRLSQCIFKKWEYTYMKKYASYEPNGRIYPHWGQRQCFFFTSTWTATDWMLSVCLGQDLHVGSKCTY